MLTSRLYRFIADLSSGGPRTVIALEKVYMRIVKWFPDGSRIRGGSLSMWWSIENLKRNGLRPATVLDIGAYAGEWTKRARPIFPGSRFLMVEAQPAKREILNKVALEHDSHLAMCLLGDRHRPEVTFYAMETGSSIYSERTSHVRQTLFLPMETLDSVVSKAQLTGPFLLKIDVQGAELDVMRGASQTLQSTSAVLMETPFLPYNDGAPVFAEYVQFMDQAGFAIYDICEIHRRSSDLAAFQVDFIFTRKDGELRADRD
jgi:FkbM family methyltransferase